MKNRWFEFYNNHRKIFFLGLLIVIGLLAFASGWSLRYLQPATQENEVQATVDDQDYSQYNLSFTEDDLVFEDEAMKITLLGADIDSYKDLDDNEKQIAVLFFKVLNKSEQEKINMYNEVLPHFRLTQENDSTATALSTAYLTADNQDKYSDMASESTERKLNPNGEGSIIIPYELIDSSLPLFVTVEDDIGEEIASKEIDIAADDN
ncbi:DUF5067 domain-containing protein [Enterococcus sp. HY326]|uniref:DUF5067 domain-containing protein n=1 Tax=Enterococcus sp. HY326 TaxID=2971265 RepID=UPI00223F1204|nr:DUF5067 domain-containing protein [Enterococcus sp. HY326]